MSRALQNCKLRPGWMKPFLAAIGNGFSEKNAANAAGESTLTIQRFAERDADFKANYAAAQAKARPRYGSRG